MKKQDRLKEKMLLKKARLEQKRVVTPAQSEEKPVETVAEATAEVVEVCTVEEKPDRTLSFGWLILFACIPLIAAAVAQTFGVAGHGMDLVIYAGIVAALVAQFIPAPVKK